MLAGLKEYREKLENRGRKEGRKEGRKDINTVYAHLLAQGRNDDLVRSIREPEFLEKIMAEFGYSDDEDDDKT